MEHRRQLVIAVVASVTDLEIQVDLARHSHGDRPGGNPLGRSASVGGGHGTTLTPRRRRHLPKYRDRRGSPVLGRHLPPANPRLWTCCPPANGSRATSWMGPAATAETRRGIGATTTCASTGPLH